MYNRGNPRFRRTINQIQSNLESANETAQVGLVSVTEHYLKPCFSSVSACVTDACSECFPDLFAQDEHHRRLRRSTGRWGARSGPESSFDFYDDWEEDENAALLGWGNDEYERSAGAEEAPLQPARRRHSGMNYGTRGSETRRTYDHGADPTVIPNQSRFGFLNKLPFGWGAGKGLRYHPNPAGLQERPKGQDSLATSPEEEIARNRPRRNTASSGNTAGSCSSRGDIFPSDDEDAVPLDDEFAEALEEAGIAPGAKTKNRAHRPSATRNSTRSTSTKSGTQSPAAKRRSSKANSDQARAQSAQEVASSKKQQQEPTTDLQEESDPKQESKAAQEITIGSEPDTEVPRSSSIAAVVSPQSLGTEETSAAPPEEQGRTIAEDTPKPHDQSRTNDTG